MRYPFATFLVTIAVFAFLGLLIASGEYKLPLSEATIRHVQITRAAVRCPDDAPAKKLYRPLMTQLQSHCKATANCEIDTNAVMQQVDIPITPACTQEIALTYQCVPLQTQKDIKSTSHHATLYRGQVATLHCAEVHL